MPDVVFSEDDRDEWAALLAFAAVRAATEVRDKANAVLSASVGLPSLDWFAPQWWEEAAATHITPVAEDVARQAAEDFADQAGVTVLPSELSALVASVVATEMLMASGRGRVAADRAASVTAQAAFGGRDKAWLVDKLGFSDGALSGPLSDAIATEIGEGLSVGAAQGAAQAVAELAVDDSTPRGPDGTIPENPRPTLKVTKTWRARMDTRTRKSHWNADGTEITYDELFELYDPDLDLTSYGLRPFSETLPISEVAGCRCYCSYGLSGKVGPKSASVAEVALGVDPDTEVPAVTATMTTETTAVPNDAPPADLSTVPDVALRDEMARRVADEALEDARDGDAEIDPARIAETTEAAKEAIDELAEEVREDLTNRLRGDEDPEDVDDDDAKLALETVAPEDAAKILADAMTTTLAPEEVEIPETEVDPDAPAESATAEWEAVLTVEGLPSGDSRMIAEGALDWRDLPLPWMSLTETTERHYLAQYAGQINEIWRDGNAVMGRGTYADNEAGQMCRALMGTKDNPTGFRGVSADIGNVKCVYATESGEILDPMEAQDAYMGGEDVMELMVQGRLLGATALPFQAFAEATGWKIERAEESVMPEAVVAAAGVTSVWRTTTSAAPVVPGSDLVALVASAAPDVDWLAPPADWFTLKPMDGPEPFTVWPDGRAYGLVAGWDDVHIGHQGKKVRTPPSRDFSKFYDGPSGEEPWSKFYQTTNRFYAGGKFVVTREGTMVKVGPVIGDTFHPDLMLLASDTQPWYADTGSAWADVCLYANEWGIVAAGAVRPDCKPHSVYRFRASDVSPDWRHLDGELKMLAILACPVSALQVDALAASAGTPKAYALFDDSTGECLALVASSGRVQNAERTVAARTALLEAEVRDLHAWRAKIEQTWMRERASKARAALNL